MVLLHQPTDRGHRFRNHNLDFDANTGTGRRLDHQATNRQARSSWPTLLVPLHHLLASCTAVGWFGLQLARSDYRRTIRCVRCIGDRLRPSPDLYAKDGDDIGLDGEESQHDRWHAAYVHYSFRHACFNILPANLVRHRGLLAT